MKLNQLWLCFLLPSFLSSAQTAKPFLSNLKATSDAPLYTTYAAALERSEFTLDEGYCFLFYDSTQGANFITDKAGDWCLAFKKGLDCVYEIQRMYQKPVITTSYPDIVRYYFLPFPDVKVEATFFLYSSRIAVQEVTIRNIGKKRVELEVISFLKNDRTPFANIQFHSEKNAITFQHREPPDNWVIEHQIPHIENVQDVFVIDVQPDQMKSLQKFELSELWTYRDEQKEVDSARVVALQKKFTLNSGSSKRMRTVRAVAPANEDPAHLLKTATKLFNEDFEKYVKHNEQLYSNIPRLTFTNSDYEMLYWSAFTLLRQCMLPPESKCNFNYYVFSREPQWGWGHGGQVFHESISMLGYAFMDPVSAMNSQRVYIERQHEDGYINYRTGPYLDETIPFNNQLTTSAPWFNWENWEIYKITRDKKFLPEAYEVGKKFYEFWLKNRDEDKDGLCEWGAHAVLECVRDGKVAVWDEVDWPSNFEALDLNCMLVQEAKSLSAIANELGLKEESDKWKADAESRKEKINRYMWDEATGFYYHVDKKNHSFTFKKENDLKRQEIIGFLPLWAGVADENQAARLLKNLTDTTKFWRRFGVPTLSADDPYYESKGYWNGPVWVQWQYLIFRGLIDYGYKKEAKELAEKVFSAVTLQLKKNHNFWELYSPDTEWAGWNRTYIWTGIVARMFIDLSNM